MATAISRIVSEAILNLDSSLKKAMTNEFGHRAFLFPGKVPEFEKDFPNLERIDPEYFRTLDKKIDYLNVHGLVPFIEVARRDIGQAWKKYYDWPGSYTRYIQYIWSRYQANICFFSPIHFDYAGASVPAADYTAACLERLIHFQQGWGELGIDTCAHLAGQPGLPLQIGDRTYKVHLDGYDLGPALRGEAAWPRKEFIYWTDDGSVAALRYDNWKITFLRQDALGLKVWQEPFTALRAPTITNLRMDPFERAEEENAMGYQRWYMERMFAIAPAGAYVGQWLQSFRDFPPRQKPGSFNLDRVMEAVSGGAQKQAN